MNFGGRLQLLSMLLSIPGILAGLTFHEYAHALVSDKLGDKTPRFQGRLTLNPLVHIDIIGFLALLVFGFGWAKPVQTNPSAYKKYYKDDLKVSFAGPLANLILAFLSAVILALFSKFTNNLVSYSSFMIIIGSILSLSVSINCVLFVLNLIPLPGFDGFHILRDLFPRFFYDFAEKVYRYQFIIMIIFIMSPLVDILVASPAAYIDSIIMKLVSIF